MTNDIDKFLREVLWWYLDIAHPLYKAKPSENADYTGLTCFAISAFLGCLLVYGIIRYFILTKKRNVK